jgi:antibiotic biosynthesis monooxygenase (ABM) superfamily enzyme
MILRSFLIWLLLAILANINGGLRNAFVTPAFGEHAGHIISSIVFCIVIFLITWLTIPWMKPAGKRESWIIGGFWLLLTAAFEFIFGHYVVGHSWERLFADYNIFAGRVWSLVLLTTFFAPFVSASLRGILTNREEK